MLSQEVLSAAAAVEKKMYLALCEVEELTMELAQAVDRRDQVSVRMFLSLRQEQVDHLQEQKALLNKQCAQLPDQDETLLRQLLNAKEPPSCTGAEELLRQVQRNRLLLERILRADRQASRRLGGASSFYEKEGQP